MIPPRLIPRHSVSNDKTTTILTSGVHQTTQSILSHVENHKHKQPSTSSALYTLPPQSSISTQPHITITSKQTQKQSKQWSQTAQSRTPSAAAEPTSTSTRPTTPKTTITRPASHGKTSSPSPPKSAIVLLASNRLPMVCSQRSNFLSRLTRRECCRTSGNSSMIRDIRSAKGLDGRRRRIRGRWMWRWDAGEISAGWTCLGVSKEGWVLDVASGQNASPAGEG
ncbi:hypothetical protein BDV97DRAFT_41730 [Delphinella strobiligena]|nr:hypothetical protein BDV97DRAFT_41730 [Delphinella strobiligena]